MHLCKVYIWVVLKTDLKKNEANKIMVSCCFFKSYIPLHHAPKWMPKYFVVQGYCLNWKQQSIKLIWWLYVYVHYTRFLKWYKKKLSLWWSNFLKKDKQWHFKRGCSISFSSAFHLLNFECIFCIQRRNNSQKKMTKWNTSERESR